MNSNETGALTNQSHSLQLKKISVTTLHTVTHTHARAHTHTHTHTHTHINYQTLVLNLLNVIK